MISVAFLWHQHQPYYWDDVTGENPMPWVRLHGVKDYYGMALHLLEVPEMACTINLVPSLVRQLQAYTEKGATDRPLQVSRIPADGLNEADSLYLLDTFFMANAEQMIKPLPRYWELYQRRNSGREQAVMALRRFGEKDLRDLQVLFNLAWIHPLAFERDPDLRELRRKGRSFTEADKSFLLEKHLSILQSILPLHRELAERGQVELTTSPYYHPILPLLLDKKLAREALPAIKLPRYTGGYPGDVALQVRRAIDLHQEVFGRAPVGMWPAEGSVCQSMIPLLAQQGIRWIATDEGILSQSTQGFISRDQHGQVRNPEQMYRPYRVQEDGQELQIVFRDHALSDRIGFHYQRSEPTAAAEDLIRHVHEIRNAVHDSGTALVSIILDGENCWEHYPGGGVEFLRALYHRCTRDPNLRPVRIGRFLEDKPPRDALPRLSAGSWIQHNFAIWVGQDEDNRAWDALHQTREHLKSRSQQGHVAAEKLAQAWEEIYIAEGSDWFWWYGDDHSSAQDALFDYLFRKHLQNVYFLLGDPLPPVLLRPINKRALRPIHTQPRSLLEIKIDGRLTFFEWLSAGRYTAQHERGTMAMVRPGPIKEIYFGFNLHTLFVRVDFEEVARRALMPFDAVRLGFAEPEGFEVLLLRPDEALASPANEVRCLTAQLCYGGVSQRLQHPIEVGVDRILELALPFAALGVQCNDSVQLYVELLEGDQSRDRAPLEGTIGFTCPSPDFEHIMWNV